MERMNRFWDDRDRGIGMEMFSDFCGIPMTTLKRVFRKKDLEMSEQVQIWVSKALWEWEQGRVGVRRRVNGMKFWEYRREVRPPLKRSWGLQVVDGRIRMDVGVRNRADYSRPTLEEQLEKK